MVQPRRAGGRPEYLTVHRTSDTSDSDGDGGEFDFDRLRLRTYVIISNQRRAFSDADSGAEDNYLRTQSLGSTLNAASSRSQSLPDLSNLPSPTRVPQNTPASPLTRPEFECYPESIKSLLSNANMTGLVMSNPPDLHYSPETTEVGEESSEPYQYMTIDVFNDEAMDTEENQEEDEVNLEEINLLPQVQLLRAALRDARDEPEDPQATVKIVRAALETSTLESFAINSPPSPTNVEEMLGIQPIRPGEKLKFSTSNESKVTSRAKKNIKLEPILETREENNKKRNRQIAELSTTGNELNLALCEAAATADLPELSSIDQRSPRSPMTVSPVATSPVSVSPVASSSTIFNTLEEASSPALRRRRSSRNTNRPSYAPPSTRRREKSSGPPRPRDPRGNSASSPPPSPSSSLSPEQSSRRKQRKPRAKIPRH